MNKRASAFWATCLSLACSVACVAEGAAFSAPLTADEADEIADIDDELNRRCQENARTNKRR